MEKLSSVLRVPTPVTTHIVQKKSDSSKSKKNSNPPPPPPPPPSIPISTNLHINGKINNNIPFENFSDSKNVYIVEKDFFEKLVENHIDKTLRRLFPKVYTESKKTEKKRFLVERNGKKSVVKFIKPTDKILDGFVELN